MYELMPWDTEVLEIPTARIKPLQTTPEALTQALADLKKQGVELVYWVSDAEHLPSQQAAEANSGFLSDTKVTYVLDVAAISPSVWRDCQADVYPHSTPNEDLLKLSEEIADQSRFGADPKLPRDKAHHLYHLWMTNSCNGSIAEAVLVLQQKQRTIAVITVGEKQGRGDIGLVAVNPDYRGQKLGMRLVRAAQAYLARSGYQQIQVVTQKANVAACQLYEKCNFQEDTVQQVYHFWLK